MKKLSLLVTLSMILLAFSGQSEACTGIKLTTKDGSAIHGRTLEFGIKLDTSIAFIPKGYSFTSTTPKGKGLSYQSKYAAIGSICYDYLLLMDGMNEAGLSVGTFYFPGFAGYTTTTYENQEHSLSPIDFSNWIVTQFSTIEEVKENLEKVVIAPTIVKGWGNTPPPFHYIVYDKNGKSIVIEPIDGRLIVYDNPLGVLTNSPTFDWHLTNLRNYINLTPQNIAPLKLEGIEFAPLGQGSGMLGLPGDFTPPSRFVRAAIFSGTATPSANANKGVLKAFHILNQFDIPIGVAREAENGIVRTDYTIATVVHDPVNLKYYIKTYEDQAIKMIDLNAFDKNSNEAKKVSTSSKQTIIDITQELKPIKKGWE